MPRLSTSTPVQSFRDHAAGMLLRIFPSMRRGEAHAALIRFNDDFEQTVFSVLERGNHLAPLSDEDLAKNIQQFLIFQVRLIFDQIVILLDRSNILYLQSLSRRKVQCLVGNTNLGLFGTFLLPH